MKCEKCFTNRATSIFDREYICDGCFDKLQEAEILDEIEVDNFKRMIRKLKLRKECGMVGCKPKTSIVLTYDGEILDKIVIE